MSERRVLFVCADRLGREIVLYEDTWYDHILVDHPRMANRVDALEQTITRPDRITRDRFIPERECYYRTGILPPPDKRYYLKVVIEFVGVGPDGIERGIVVTAYPSPHIAPDEAHLW